MREELRPRCQQYEYNRNRLFAIRNSPPQEGWQAKPDGVVNSPKQEGI